ncbi:MULTISPECIES: hypothetical protein [unclassified Ruegeria]|uniref:hypothetical protein n=1 Tax=unclassified Ruegeria TaxID=2625375 RepID=UPI00148A0C10|nr:MULTISPECIES: hypothetical protein [unclassified Ruegeria]NOD36695.1 hypothetical protein [Ruegeria sp. HKCCD7296]NOD46736.1 hypothetical protein [Ruegeria sp. HKCCD5849]NOD51059.1 hypothetical protein [Ruegeria sp. HKCCD5851]NOD67878.1 hypothetical protein [Ruegeria sp. HKCCD7303]NOE42588.1 hypothetical protein [Ruegeria sp. HKCCD7319]
MSKLDQIIANNARTTAGRRKPGFLSQRARVLLLTLTCMLLAFIFFTQPQVRTAIETLIG